MERWEHRSEIPLLLLVAAFLVAYAWPVLDPRIDPDLQTSLTVLSWTVWAAFVVDFLNRSVTTSLIGKVSTCVVGAAVMAAALASIAMLDAGQDAAYANITTFGDALWWSAETVTTVGYGDRYPVTTEGWLIAFGLMIVGIALLGAITASVAAWMVAQVQQDHPPESDEARQPR